ncbi:hypothetical protein Dred_2923 [Desulforamulus reducens MI-1]|uniref:Copper amine oxidase-like N-terminal domain-containing protein n=1 Tax=Desulforamulus reducens (strain ATCC BAA-1160 / DSM 100696 / MI-1) TaxID=349161 RepID=A4J8M3_DESRM|nr:copper amine oxidase N-terminal domain-containing protein [Desulforamulus reducens]ABO51426.1 hypothetical protein Dred_2923 [Desulforamulus reducens MI-1]
MPKKLLGFWTFILILLVPFFPASAGIPVALDGKLLSNSESMVIEGTAMVPIRPIMEELGYKLGANIQEGIVWGYKGQDSIQINLWQPNGNIELTAAPQLIAGKTYLSAQDIGKLLNLEVFQEPGLQLVSLFQVPEMTEEGVIGHLLAADRQMLRVEYFNNPDFLAEHYIAPSPNIDSYEDLRKHLMDYWDESFIENLWQAASRDGHYVGLFTEGSIPLLYNKELNVMDLSETGAKVRVLMPVWGEDEDGLTEFETFIYTLQKNKGNKLVIKNIEPLD